MPDAPPHCLVQGSAQTAAFDLRQFNTKLWQTYAMSLLKVPPAGIGQSVAEFSFARNFNAVSYLPGFSNYDGVSSSQAAVEHRVKQAPPEGLL